MASTVKAVPRGYHTVTPSLPIKDCAGALDFYRKAFGAEEKARMLDPNGKVGHAELVIGDSILNFGDESPEMGARGPTPDNPSPVTLQIYTDDAKTLWKRATAAGVTVTMELAEQFWGDLYGTFTDRYGYKWAIGQRVKDLSDKEIDAAMKIFMANYKPNKG